MSAPRQDDRANAMFALYSAGHSLERVAMAFSVSRQTVYVVFRRRGFALRPRPAPLPFVVFGGRKYTLRNTGYYGATGGKRALLHRDVWEAHNGPIPPGFDIHHRDHDRSNNRIANLELIRKDEHARQHPHGQNQWTKRWK